MTAQPLPPDTWILVALKRVSKKMSSTLSSSHAEDVTFQLGELFKTFEELECKLKLYENATLTKFWMRDCRTVNAARKRTTRPLSDFIKYYQVSYRCIHGGRKFVPKGEGKRSTL